MPAPPYDRALALASLVSTMADHYLDVHCSCGARRVLSLAMMARDRRVAGYTLAHVALKLRCQGCHTGPDQVHLTATTHGIGPAAAGGGGLVWTLPLVDRPPGGARQLRHGAEAVRQAAGG